MRLHERHDAPLLSSTRNPPKKQGYKPQPYSRIAALVGAPKMKTSRIKMVVKRFLKPKQKRGRKAGWRKTTPREDQAIIDAFLKVRTPRKEFEFFLTRLPASISSHVSTPSARLLEGAKASWEVGRVP